MEPQDKLGLQSTMRSSAQGGEREPGRWGRRWGLRQDLCEEATYELRATRGRKPARQEEKISQPERTASAKASVMELVCFLQRRLMGLKLAKFNKQGREASRYL